MSRRASIERPERIALYFFRLGGAAGGAERMICRLADALKRRGFEVALVSWDTPEAHAFYPIGAGIAWHRLGFSAGWWDKIRRTFRLARLLREQQVDVLLGFVMSGDKTVYAAAKLAGARIIVAERNAPTMYSLRYGAVQRLTMFALLHLADRIAVQLEGFIKAYPQSLRPRISAIPNPAPVVSVRADPGGTNPDGGRTLLYVGRLDPVQKRPRLALEAFVRLAARHPEWRLRMLGDGPDRATLLGRAASVGLESRISVESASQEVFQAYAGARLFVMPSLWEGFPNALAEAMAHGVPAVGFAQAAGVADLIELGGGWLAGDGDEISMLTKELDEAMSSDEERVARGARAREAIAAFEPEGIFDRWADLLRSVARET